MKYFVISIFVFASIFKTNGQVYFKIEEFDTLAAIQKAKLLCLSPRISSIYMNKDTQYSVYNINEEIGHLYAFTLSTLDNYYIRIVDSLYSFDYLFIINLKINENSYTVPKLVKVYGFGNTHKEIRKMFIKAYKLEGSSFHQLGYKNTELRLSKFKIKMNSMSNFDRDYLYPKREMIIAH